MSEWAQMLSDFMANPKEENATYSNNSMNYCLSAALGCKDFSLGKTVPAGTTFWGAAACPTDADAGVDSDLAWSRVFKADGPQKIMQDDGSEKDVNICEYQTIVDAITHDLSTGPMPNGVWIGGLKHSVTKKEAETGQNNEYNFLSVLCMRRGEKGHWIICTDADKKGKCCIVTAEFDKGGGCTAPMAKIVALDFAKWLHESGTDSSDAIAV